MAKWDVDHIFSCAHRQQGDGIVERQHRTVKRMAAHSGGSVQEMAYWYNFSSKVVDTTPAESIYRYSGQSLPGVKGNSFRPQRDTHLNPYSVGDRVYVKPQALLIMIRPFPGENSFFPSLLSLIIGLRYENIQLAITLGYFVRKLAVLKMRNTQK